MFTIIYDEKTGNVINIVGGQGDPDSLVSAISDNYKHLTVAELPKVKQFRQVLKVINNSLTVDDLILTEEQKNQIVQTEISALRSARIRECFSIVNQNFIIDGKSKTWFETLTEEQKLEANNWVQAWRDVTNNYNINSDMELLIPKKPEWLK